VTDGALKVMGYGAFLNFLSFAGISFLYGDAIQGKVVSGHYFLGNHGLTYEVSHTIFVLSAIHGCSALLGLPLLAGLGWKRKNSN
jgi:hypothetical protein